MTGVSELRRRWFRVHERHDCDRVLQGCDLVKGRVSIVFVVIDMTEIDID